MNFKTYVTLFLLTINLVLVFAIYQELNKYPTLPPDPPSHDTISQDPDNVSNISFNFPAPKKRLRYSLIPGGISSVEQLHERVNADPEMKMLLTNFDWDKAHISTLTETGCYFSAFRKPATNIHWTRSATLCLPVGEKIITDGQILVRMACANIIAATPRFPVDQATDGPELNLEVPPMTPPIIVTAQNDLPSLPPSAFVPVTSGSYSVPTGCCGGFITGDNPKPVTVPEPSTLVLLSTGLIGLILWRKA